MKLKTTLTEILKRTDEAYVDVSEDRALRAFYSALINTLLTDNFDETEAFGFAKRKTITISDVHTTYDDDKYIDLKKEFDSSLLVIRNIYFDPNSEIDNDDYGSLITPVNEHEIRRINMGYFKPVYDYRYRQVGNLLYTYPYENWKDKDIVYEVILAPPEYVDDDEPLPSDGKWYNDTDMLAWMTQGFLEKMINLASEIFNKELLNES
jgi:hypothetical protein